MRFRQVLKLGLHSLSSACVAFGLHATITPIKKVKAATRVVFLFGTRHS